MAPSSPSIAAIGPLTLDVIDGESRPGGAVAYAARIAHALGERVAILTIGAADTDLSAFVSHELTLIDDRSLSFEHSTVDGARRLRLLARPSRPLRSSDVPAHWDGLTTLILAPLLADDLDLDSFAAISGIERRALLAQGLQRRVGRDQLIEHQRAPSAGLLPFLTPDTSLFLSTEETAAWDSDTLPALVDSCARVVITEGADGAVVHRAGERSLHVDAAPANVVDSTGAGDVFATAYMLALAAGAEDAAAARLASASAAAAIEQPGAAAISAAAIESRARPQTTVGAA
jgi:sugar/nucleoside kinase (ribokinase family)